LTRNEAFLYDEAILEKADFVIGSYAPVPLWTDQYSNLFQIMD
jgi:hypothetical protein